jgi:NADH dehydrogenase
MVIIGGGFGGLRAARALKSAPVDVTLIDRRNYHLFQPLLYQVATGSLSPGQIAAPIRGVAALRLGFVTAEQFDAWVRPEQMVHPLAPSA